MVRNFKQSINILLLVVYAIFFASANLFYHSHRFKEGNVVHSHIAWGHKAHHHSATQLHVIDQLNNTTFDKVAPTDIHQPFTQYLADNAPIKEVVAHVQNAAHAISLRAPPTL